MVDMAYTEADKKQEIKKQKSLMDDAPEYPYGLQISLRPEDVEKLGCDEAEIGDVKEFCIKVKITSKSLYQSEDTPKSKPSMGLQITHMEAMDKKEKKSDADKMYGE